MHVFPTSCFSCFVLTALNLFSWSLPSSAPRSLSLSLFSQLWPFPFYIVCLLPHCAFVAYTAQTANSSELTEVRKEVKKKIDLFLCFRCLLEGRMSEMPWWWCSVSSAPYFMKFMKLKKSVLHLYSYSFCRRCHHWELHPQSPECITVWLAARSSAHSSQKEKWATCPVGYIVDEDTDMNVVSPPFPLILWGHLETVNWMCLFDMSNWILCWEDFPFTTASFLNFECLLFWFCLFFLSLVPHKLLSHLITSDPSLPDTIHTFCKIIFSSALSPLSFV